MKKIMIDMDDVICTGGFIALVNKFLNSNYKLEDCKNYYIQDLIPQDKMEKWSKFFEENDLYNEVYLLPKAYDVIEKLNKKYEVYISTAYIFRDKEEISGQVLKNKFNYLYKTLPFIKPYQYIFINNKCLLDCDIIIDDKLSNLQGKAKIKILFPAYHNKNIDRKQLKRRKSYIS